VRRLVPHGAWVDVGAGVHGLLHIRDMSTSFVHHPSQVVGVGDHLPNLVVKYVDSDRSKLALSLVARAQTTTHPRQSLEALQDSALGTKVEGRVVRVTNYGAYVDIGAVVDAFLHVSELWGRRPRDTLEVLRFGQTISVTVAEVDPTRSRIRLVARSANRDERREQEEMEARRTRQPPSPAAVFERPAGRVSAESVDLSGLDGLDWPAAE